MKPAAVLVYAHGLLVVAKLGPNGYRLPDGTVLRWPVT